MRGLADINKIKERTEFLIHAISDVTVQVEMFSKYKKYYSVLRRGFDFYHSINNIILREQQWLNKQQNRYWFSYFWSVKYNAGHPMLH